MPETAFTKASNQFLGPNYNYAMEINGPDDISMSDGSSFQALADDVGGLIEYIEILVSGDSNATKRKGKPLGNKYFLKTAAQCKDRDTGNMVPRSLYINNVPTGNIPFISSLTGTDFKVFRGLIPGVMQNVEVLNPIVIAESLFLGPDPSCALIEFPQLDQSGNTDLSSAYILINDLYNLDPCDIGYTFCKPEWGFMDGPMYAPRCCHEGFKNLSPANINNILDDKFTEFYFIILGILGLYILLCLLHKSR